MKKTPSKINLLELDIKHMKLPVPPNKTFKDKKRYTRKIKHKKEKDE
jgi:hypothetical protein